MKIAFDGQFFLKNKRTGVGWSADNIMRNVNPQGKHQCFLNFFSLGYDKGAISRLGEYEAYGYRLQECKWFHDVLFREISRIAPLKYQTFFPEEADVTVFFNFTAPLGVKGKTIAVVHDMAYLAHPETVRNKTRKLLLDTMEQSCARASHIVTVSEFSKGEIVRYLGVDEGKIDVVSLGVDFQRFHPNYEASLIEQVKSKYDICGEYLFYIGTVEPRKNLERLLYAYANLKKELHHVPQLIIAGQRGWMSEGIYQAASAPELEGCVKFIGYIAQDEEALLMSGAMCFVFPSVYEGFGLPPLEAMACGTPVLTSRAASLPEVVGDCGVLVDPFRVESIQDGLGQIVTDPKLRKDLSHRGRERARLFSWERAGKAFEEICSKVCREDAV